MKEHRSVTRPPRRESRLSRREPSEIAPSETFTTPDGRVLTLRPIRPDDAAALRRGFARLTPDQVRLRTFHRINELSAAAAERMTRIDPATTTAYVAVDADGEIRGEARFHADTATDSAEFGIVVDPDFTHQGIARRLMRQLVDDARRRNLDELWGDVLGQNQAMLDFAKELGAQSHWLEDDPGVARVSFHLRRAGARRKPR
jgi:RimJ/RimL family protein N-acetyltransferase